MMRTEFKKLFHKRSFYILTAISLFLFLSWIISGYVSGSEMLDKGVPYANTMLSKLEPQHIFGQSMLQVTLSIYIFPYVIMGVILVYDDLKEKTLLMIAVSNGNHFKYFFTKLNVLLIYNLAMVGVQLILGLAIAFAMPKINHSNWVSFFSIQTLLSFVMFGLGISFWSLAGMAITFITNSAVGGSCVAIYLLLERIYTSNTAVAIHNSTLMRINEFLPWANFNTFFVYASNLKYLMSKLSEDEKIANASVLSMYKMIAYNGTQVPYPYFKSIWSIIGVCLLYAIVALCLLYYGYIRRIRKM